MLDKRLSDFNTQGQAFNDVEDCLEKLLNLVPSSEFTQGVGQTNQVERGMSCDEETYLYKSSKREVLMKKFEVRGVNNRFSTHLMQIDISSEFAFSSGLSVMLRRDTEDDEFSLECLQDNSCQVAMPTHKNHRTLDAVLTPGNYQLILYLDKPTHHEQ